MTPPTYAVRLYPVSLGKRRVKTRRLPPSLNARLHWRERALWTAAWKQSVGWGLKEAKVPKMQSARITIINSAIQLTDEDNLASASKPIIDALVENGILPDDDPSHLTLSRPRQVRVHSRKDERLILEICPM